jgi:hypothetical protein
MPRVAKVFRNPYPEGTYSYTISDMPDGAKFVRGITIPQGPDWQDAVNEAYELAIRLNWSWQARTRRWLYRLCEKAKVAATTPARRLSFLTRLW